MGKEGKKLVGYPDAFKTFTGRFLDSVNSRDYQYTFRTARARMLRIAPERNRVYMILGSALAAYDLNNFFSRLEAKEDLWPSTAVPVSPANQRAGAPEVMLMWDRFFYAESGGGWQTQAGDGQERLFGFDWDDRGNVYLAYGAYSWGIVKDPGDTSGGRMESLYQHTEFSPGYTNKDVTDTVRICTLKSGGSYYAAVSGKYETVDIFNVTNPAQPTKHRVLNIGPIIEFAKSDDGTRIAVVRGDGSFSIYSTDGFLNGSTPLVRHDQYNGSFGSVTTDGTNFFAGVRSLDGKLAISVFQPSGSSYNETRHTTATPIAAGVTIRYGAGYISAAAVETTFGSFNVRLFKLSGLTPAEIPLNGYYAKHYTVGSSQLGADYTYPLYSVLLDTMVHKKGSKYYLLVSNFGLGDVYEIKGGGSISPAVKKVGTSANPYSAATAGSGPYYGDEITFTATSNGSPAGVTWNWGDGSTTDTTTTATPDVAHQYHGAAWSQLPLTRTVTATSATDSSIVEQFNVTLKKPTVRLGIRNTSLLFLQPNASAPSQIVSGDEWIDASDGADEGHFGEWVLDGGAPVKQKPSQTLGVGACGQHTLAYTAHYGRRDGSFNPVAGDASYTINGITYSVSPFAVVLGTPTSSGTNVVFKATTRASATDVTGGGAALASYTWEFVDSNGALVAPDRKVTIPGTLAAVPDFVVPRTAFQGASNWRARLTVAVDPTLIPAASCKTYASVQTLTSTLSAPNPGEIVRTGCDSAGAPCSFTVPAAAGADASGWTYQWSATGPAAVAGATTLATYSPVFTASGNYTISVVVSNALGDVTKSTVWTIAAPSCGTMYANSNVYIGWQGSQSGCTPSSGNCTPSETINFTASTFGYNFTCGAHTFFWNFGDGTSSSEQNPTKSFSQSGSYTISLTITPPGAAAVTMTQPLTVSTGGGGNPNPGSCGTMVANSNVYVSWNGSTSGCTATAGACSANETVNFTAGSYGYNYSCGTHSFSWNFGDGTSSNQQNPSKTYTANGTYTVTLTITQPGGGQATMSQPITVGTGGGNPNPGTCGTMVANSNVYIGWLGTRSSCTASAGNCTATEAINFTASSFGYNFTCGTHTFSWNFGDGSNSNQQNPSKAYAQDGTYTVSLTITQPGGAQVTMSQPVKVGSGNSNPNPGTCSTMVPNSNVYIGFVGGTSGCTAASSNCAVSEAVNFTASTYNYNFSCGTHTFSWNFGDGTSSNQQNPSKTYTQNGSYTVTLTITQPGGAQATMTQPITIGTGGSQGSCGTMAAGQNVYISFTGPTTGCNPLVGTCSDEEAVSFSAGAFGYSFSCSPHTFEWDFGDGQTGTGQNVTHKYSGAGNFTVKLKITNSKQTENMTQLVRVSGKSPAIPTTNRRRSTGRR